MNFKQVTMSLLLLLIVSSYSFAQIKGVILNKTDGTPVPYANIWVENEQIGTSSEENGTFIIDRTGYTNKFLIISCVGFQKARIAIADGLNKIELVPVTYELKDVTINKSKNGNFRIVGTVDKSNRLGWHGTFTPIVMARYYPYRPEYKATPYLKKISMTARSKINGAQVQLRLLGVGSNGRPGEDLFSEILTVSAKMGTTTLDIDLSTYDFEIPATGFFIACEWMIIEKNKRFERFRIPGTREWADGYVYEPQIAYERLNSSSVNWQYISGAWINKTDNYIGNARKPIKNTSIAQLMYQLTLSD